MEWQIDPATLRDLARRRGYLEIAPMFPRTTRVGWLAREFDGSAAVEFAVRSSRIPVDLVVRIAGFHGYVLHGQTVTRASGPILRFYEHV